jgi:hypothetical protein
MKLPHWTLTSLLLRDYASEVGKRSARLIPCATVAAKPSFNHISGTGLMKSDGTFK